jgi:hypothetical protein
MVAAAVAILAASLLVAFLHRPRSITAEAVRLDAAFAQGDADRLYDAAAREEIEKNHLTRDKFRELFQTLVWPRLGRFRHLQSPLTEALMNGSEGAAYITGDDGAGNSHEFVLNAWASHEGPKVGLMTTTLFAAWIEEYAERRGIKLDGSSVRAAKLAGYESDRKELERLGIVGILDVGPMGVKFMSWDELEAGWRKHIADGR